MTEEREGRKDSGTGRDGTGGGGVGVNGGLKRNIEMGDEKRERGEWEEGRPI